MLSFSVAEAGSLQARSCRPMPGLGSLSELAAAGLSAVTCKTPAELAARMAPPCSCRPVLDEELLPEAVACGLAQPAPDRLTPRRAAAAIWSWAPGHPHAAAGSQVLPMPAGPTSEDAPAAMWVSAEQGRARTPPWPYAARRRVMGKQALCPSLSPHEASLPAP